MSVTADLTTVPSDQLDRVESKLDALARRLDEGADQRRIVSELAADVAPIARHAMGTLTGDLAELEARGYFGFARRGAGVVDRVVTSFTEEDIEALGDNIVLILETVKEMTQPEVMTMLRRTAHVVNEPGDDLADAPPSALALLREMRDPEVRRGLSRLLTMLRAMSSETSSGERTEQ